jgi:hypothetical protein
MEITAPLPYLPLWGLLAAIMDETHESGQWYFAYGSNMSASVFTTRRNIEPLQTEVACIKSHTLCFNIMGVPYSDPGMGGLRKIKDGEESADIGPVFGVAYLLSRDSFGRVIASEGYAPYSHPAP